MHAHSTHPSSRTPTPLRPLPPPPPPPPTRRVHVKLYKLLDFIAGETSGFLGEQEEEEEEGGVGGGEGGERRHYATAAPSVAEMVNVKIS